VSRRARGTRPRRSGAGSGIFAVAGWLVVHLAALSLVTWRQTRGVEMEKALRAVEVERAIMEAEQVAADRRVEELRSRARVVRIARDRLGMHIPADREIIFLPATESMMSGIGGRAP